MSVERWFFKGFFKGFNKVHCSCLLIGDSLTCSWNHPSYYKDIFGCYSVNTKWNLSESELQKIEHPSIKEVRGRGLFIGIELTENARPYCESLKELGLLCKETHDTVIRFAPPLVITKEELDLAIEKIKQVFK